MHLLLTLIALVSLSACAAKDNLPQTGVKSLAWLAGTWMSETEHGQFVEEWRETADLLKGQGRMVTGTDTANMEQLSILKYNDGLEYVVTFPNREVRFVMTSQTYKEEFKHLQYNEGYLVKFVNDKNDFPREIVYDRPHNDSLYITLTGDEAGKSTSITFKMKRVK